MSMTKANHHKAALRENLHTKQFPKGLCVYIEPHSFEPDELVMAEWDIAHTEFRKELISILIRHYEKKVRVEREHQDSQLVWLESFTYKHIACMTWLTKIYAGHQRDHSSVDSSYVCAPFQLVLLLYHLPVNMCIARYHILIYFLYTHKPF